MMTGPGREDLDAFRLRAREWLADEHAADGAVAHRPR